MEPHWPASPEFVIHALDAMHATTLAAAALPQLVEPSPVSPNIPAFQFAHAEPMTPLDPPGNQDDGFVSGPDQGDSDDSDDLMTPPRLAWPRGGGALSSHELVALLAASAQAFSRGTDVSVYSPFAGNLMARRDAGRIGVVPRVRIPVACHPQRSALENAISPGCASTRRSSARRSNKGVHVRFAI